jgi:hypothetical protein
MATRDDGRRAYLGYCESSSGKSLISGQDLPSWNDLKQEIKDAWIAAADAVLYQDDDIVEYQEL